jgi:hypothetical protein
MEYQQVYVSSAFPGSITVNSLTFYGTFFGGGDAVVPGTYAFSWGYTSRAAGALSPLLASNFDSGPSSSIGSVVVSFSDFTSVGPSYTFPVTPFAYDPSLGNLLLDVYATYQQPFVAGANEVDMTGAVTSRAYSFNGNSFGFADDIGLVTGFGTTPEPSSFELLGGGFAGLIAIGWNQRWRKFFGRPVRPDSSAF